MKERSPMEKMPIIRVEGTPEERSVLERSEYRHKLFTHLAMERYGLSGEEFRKLAFRPKGDISCFENWNSLNLEVNQIVGDPVDYFSEGQRRQKEGLPSQYQEWQDSLIKKEAAQDQ